MSATPHLSPLLHARLAAVGRRVRLLALVRGVSEMVLALTLVGGAALLADYGFDLPSWARRAWFSAWCGIGVTAVLTGLVRPLLRRQRPEDLAAVVEEAYPELDERLYSTVELAHGTGHGSPALIGLLERETEAKSGAVDFPSALSCRRVTGLGTVAGFVLALALVPAVVAPGEFTDRMNRFLFSYSKWVDVPYTFAVTPGDAVVAVGRPLTFSVQILPRNERVQLPTACALVGTDADGREWRQRMTADRSDTFSLTYTVRGDFHYRVETGPGVSDTFQVTGVVPVELAAESPILLVTPPEYARTAFDEETYHGLMDLSALKHSQVRFDFRFTRPVPDLPGSAFLEWTTGEAREGKAGTQTSSSTNRLPLVLSEDRRAASLQLPASATGSYRLVLVAEHDIRTELDGGTLTVKEDEPPQIVHYSGPENRKAVPPYERLPLEVSLVDDVAVAGAELEYRVNDGPVQREALTLDGRNTREAKGRHVFALAGRVKEGDEVRYRLRAWDNLPEAFGGPHVVYHPADHWQTLVIARDALPLKEQDILAQRDSLDRRLENIKADLLKEQRGAYKLRQESRDEKALSPAQADDLQQLQRDNQASENALRELSRAAAAAPELQPVSDGARAVADREMRQAEAALRQTGEKQRTPDERDQQLRKADAQLESALDRLDQLRKDNERIARERLDQAKVEALAEREKDLAERAAELAKKDPDRDPAAKDQLEQVRREQDEVAAELQKLAEQSELLRQALEEARAEQAKALAEQARELAQAQRDLEQAQTGAERKRNAEQLAELARKQQELAEKADVLARQTRQSAAAARTAPLQPEEERRAAAALRLGDAEDALKHQAQAARDLERLANDLDRARDLARDPREAAKQLARLQEALLQRANRGMQDKNDDWRAEVKEEERALQRAVEQLSVPPGNPVAQQAKRDAAERAGKAADVLAKKDPDARSLRSNMDEARRRLERLADELSPLEQRRKQTQQAVAQLRKQQDEIAKQAEKAEQEAKKDDPQQNDRLAKKLTEAARKQAEVAEALGRIDAPNLEARRQQAQESLNRALADLMDARREGIPASQQEARRQLERLEQALQGKEPDDEPTRALTRQTDREKGEAEPSPQEAARQAAQEQRELAKATKEAQDRAEKQTGEAGKKALEKALEDIARRQEELNRRVSQLPANQMQRNLEQARELMNQARQALARQDATEARRNQDDAARALDRLAQRLPDKSVTTARQQQPETSSPQGLPNKEQSEQARQLAREQRELGDAVRRKVEAARAENTPAKENPLGDLSRQQTEVAKQAAELARQVAKEDGEKSSQARQAQQAGQTAKQAAEKVQAGAVGEAQPAGKQAAEQLRELARQLSQTPRGNADPDGPDALQTARQLTRQQEELNRRLEAAAGNPDAARAQQAARQQELERQAGDLTQELDRLARQMSQTPPAQQAARQAGQAGQQAQAAMRQAQQQSRQGNQGPTRQAQQQAAQALDRAAQRADQAGARQAAGRQDAPQQGSPQAGQALQQAQGQMAQAQAQMSQGQPQGAQASMQQASQSLQQAAQQMARGGQQPGQPTQMAPPGERGVGPGGPIDVSVFGPELKQYAGKSWGELPGELRTKIVQDMKAKYGDDYARLIKLYFEQMAATSRPVK